MAGREREGARTRTMLAQMCAKIMVEEGVRDFLAAKRKAVQRLGMTARIFMPSNVEIETALTEYQRLFYSEEHAAHVARLRRGALDAMRFFTRFRPRLVGSVLAGTAGQDADVQLHLFADKPEELECFLVQQRIPYDAGVRRLRVGCGLQVCYPTYAFGAADINYDLTLLPCAAEREAPRSQVDGRPMRRASLRELESVIADSSSRCAVDRGVESF